MNEVPVGISWPDQKERFARLKEAVGLIETLWREEFVDFDGQFFHTHDATIYDRPERPVRSTSPPRARPPHAWPAGWPRASSAPAARVRRCTPRPCCPRSPRGPEKAGRDVAALDRMIEMKVSFDPDPERAREDTKIWAALALSPEQKTGVHDPRDLEVLARAAEPIAHTRWLVSSDPDEHVDQIAPYLGYGFNHLVFHFPGADQEAAIARYAELVLPRLRARFG